MVRARFIVQVRYGHFAEYLKALEQLNEIARAPVAAAAIEARFTMPRVSAESCPACVTPGASNALPAMSDSR